MVLDINGINCEIIMYECYLSSFSAIALPEYSPNISKFYIM